MKTAKQHKTYIEYWWGCPNFNLEAYIEQIMWESKNGMSQVVDVNGAAEEHVCLGCGKSIDLNVCWCGDLIRAHGELHDNHNAIPMGCECGRSKL